MEECGCELFMWGIRLLGQAVVGIFLLHHHHKHVERRDHRLRKETPARPLVEVIERK